MKYLILALALVGAVACEQKPAETTEPTQTAEQKPADQTAAQKEEVKAEPEKAPESGAAVAMVTVTAEGSTFDPPVKAEQIPAGAWYCDMGTVEFARTEQGDGKCPKCGMMLKQKPADGAAAAPAEGGEHGHDHGEGGHDHAH